MTVTRLNETVHATVFVQAITQAALPSPLQKKTALRLLAVAKLALLGLYNKIRRFASNIDIFRNRNLTSFRSASPFEYRCGYVSLTTA